MNKEELNKEIEKLKVSLEAHEEQVKDLNHDLAIATLRLEDCDKPKLTSKQFDALHRVIETSVENFDFSQVDNYNVEMQMEYDNKVYLSHINFEQIDDLADEIYKAVEKCFGITEESDDTDTVPSE